MKSKIRILHAAAGAQAIDIYVDGKLQFSNFNFAKITPYTNITPGKHEFKIFEAGKTSNPLFINTYEIIPNEIVTLSIVFLENNLTIFTLKDNPTNNSVNISFVRFINLCPNSPLFTLSLPDGNALFKGVEYLETTGFYPLSPGLYNFIVTATNDSFFKKYISNIQLNENSDHTIFILGLVNEKPELGFLITDDNI